MPESKPVVVVGELAGPHVFIGLGAHGTIEEAIESVKEYHLRTSARPDVQFRVYFADDPDGARCALIEAYDNRGDMVSAALYKVIAGRYHVSTAA